jgi:hypothetical protein
VHGDPNETLFTHDVVDAGVANYTFHKLGILSVMLFNRLAQFRLRT